MTKQVILYIISISLQLSGSLLLMVFSMSTNRKKVIERFINKNDIVKDYNSKIEYDDLELKQTFKISYLNRISFGLIAVGYLVGIFGEIDHNHYTLVTLCIIGLTFLLIILSYVVVEIIIKNSRTINKEITLEEMKEYNIEPNIQEITKEEIDELWNNK